MHKPLIAVLLPLLLIVCGAQTLPTATEALSVRCTQMADQLAEAFAWHKLSAAGAAIGMSAADVSYKGQRFFRDGDAGWEAAMKYMDELMADPRKQ